MAEDKAPLIPVENYEKTPLDNVRLFLSSHRMGGFFANKARHSEIDLYHGAGTEEDPHTTFRSGIITYDPRTFVPRMFSDDRNWLSDHFDSRYATSSGGPPGTDVIRDIYAKPDKEDPTNFSELQLNPEGIDAWVQDNPWRRKNEGYRTNQTPYITDRLDAIKKFLGSNSMSWQAANSPGNMGTAQCNTAAAFLLERLLNNNIVKKDNIHEGVITVGAAEGLDGTATRRVYIDKNKTAFLDATNNPRSLLYKWLTQLDGKYELQKNLEPHMANIPRATSLLSRSVATSIPTLGLLGAAALGAYGLYRYQTGKKKKKPTRKKEAMYKRSNYLTRNEGKFTGIGIGALLGLLLTKWKNKKDLKKRLLRNSLIGAGIGMGIGNLQDTRIPRIRTINDTGVNQPEGTYIEDLDMPMYPAMYLKTLGSFLPGMSNTEKTLLSYDSTLPQEQWLPPEYVDR